MRDRYVSRRAEIARLRAEAEGQEEVAFPSDVLEEAPEKAAAQADVFLARKEWLKAQVAILEANAAQKHGELRETRARVKQQRGRASRRERVCQYVYISVFVGSSKKDKN